MTEQGRRVVRVPASEVTEAGSAALQAHGATAEDALAQATHLVEGELRGHPSHGLLRLPTLVDRLDAGLIVSGKPPTKNWVGSASLHVDGHDGFGPAIASVVIDALTSQTSSTGVAVAAIHHSHHLGMIAPYVEHIAHAGNIGIISTTSEALIHPWGGAKRLLGTNPIGIGIPSSETPLVLDMTTGAVSMGKLIDYAANQQDIPRGWAVDAYGKPTTDPTSAMRGAISPFGGPKGYALGLALEAMVGLLTGTAFGQNVVGTLDSDDHVTKGDVIIIISPTVFGANATDEYLSHYLDQVRASAFDGGAVMVPGDGARSRREQSLREGIDLDRTLWQRVLALTSSTQKV